METMMLRVTAIRREATETHTIFFERADGAPLAYQAGQFLTLLFVFQGRALRRSYSFSTSPGVDRQPAITVKRVANGEISRFMLDHLRVGDLLTSLPPSGRFTLEADVPGRPTTPLLFIAAGSGLVPVFSLLKQALKTHQITLITQQHDIAATPFRDQLQALTAANPNFKWIDLLTVRLERLTNWWLEEWLTAAAGGLTGYAGELTASANDLTTSAIDLDLAQTRFYLCGPPSFMRMVQYTLRLMGVPDQHIRREHFTIERLHPAPPAVDPTPRTVTIDAGSHHYRFETAWPESILTAGLKHGIPLPYSCRAGRCSTCVARCIKGRVKMTNNEVLTEKELSEGWILTCTGYAESDLELAYR